MKSRMVLVCVSAMFCAAAACGARASETFRMIPSQITGLRGSPSASSANWVLTFNAVKAGTEDRTVAHFSLSGLQDVQNAILMIDVDDLDPGAPYGQFDVYSFAGDGVVSVDEWNAGTLFHSFVNVDGHYFTLSVDATNLLQDAVARGDSFLSFCFRDGNGNDRYWIRDPANPHVADPDGAYMMVTVPEPVTLAMMALGGLVLRRRRS